QRLSMVGGVSSGQVYGAQKYAVRVQVNPDELAARGVGIDDVQKAIEQSNTNLPTGKLYGERQSFTVMSNGQLTNAAAYRPLIVAYRSGVPIRLEELGNVIDDVENNKSASWYDGVRGIILAIQKQPGTNTVEVAESIRALLPQLRRSIPPAVNMEIAYDSSGQIEQSIGDVKFTLVLTVCLVVMVIFLFLRNLSATLIPGAAVPLSILGTFAAMYLLGYSLNNLSLMALTLSVGFVVDDAIVMLENLVRHMEMGKEPLQAARDGASQIGFTILSRPLSLAAVFIPLVFMGGIIGRLLHEFAVTIGAAILVSGFVSLTLTPMLCSRFLRHRERSEHGRLFNLGERIFNAWLRGYNRSLKGVLRHKFATLMVSFGLIGLTFYLYTISKTGFIPDEDQGLVFAFTEAQQGIAFQDMMQLQQRVADVVRFDPNVMNTMSSLGNPTNQGRMFFRLKDKKDRVNHMSAMQVIQELRPKVSQIPGLNVFMQIPPTIRIGGNLTKSQYQYTMQSPDTTELYQDAPKLESALRALPQLQDVTSDLQVQNP